MSQLSHADHIALLGATSEWYSFCGIKLNRKEETEEEIEKGRKERRKEKRVRWGNVAY